MKFKVGDIVKIKKIPPDTRSKNEDCWFDKKMIPLIGSIQRIAKISGSRIKLSEITQWTFVEEWLEKATLHDCSLQDIINMCIQELKE
jgi:hypothetical protein